MLDFHTHVFPDDLAERAISKLREASPESVNYTNGTLCGLIGSMQANGVDVSVTLPIATKESQVEVINLAAGSSKLKNIVAFGSLYPFAANCDAHIDRLVTLGVKGIKLHPEYQNFYVDDSRFYPMYESLASAGLVILFHAGKDPAPFATDHAQPAAIARIVRHFPSLKIVAAHLGGWKQWEEVYEILAGENLYFDTSALTGYLPPEQFVKILNRHGSDYVLFGTDSPWFDQGAVKLWIEELPVGDEIKEKIFWKNGAELLEIE